MAKNLTSFTKRGVERRTLSSRSASKRILIFCGGKKTEPNYFKDLRRVRGLTATLVIEGVGEDPTQLVERAIAKVNLEALRKACDDIWSCTFTDIDLLVDALQNPKPESPDPKADALQNPITEPAMPDPQTA
jgi:hypothetical protein